jgi:predicted AAA+ superfamily ATPase
MIPRFIESRVLDHLAARHKIILVFGARQVGKTTLLHDIQQKLEFTGRRVRYINCDVQEERQAVNTTARALLDRLVMDRDILMIDEAQNLDNPGLTLKIFHDTYPHIGVIATGSSSFDLRNRVSDALTGRYIDFTLYPLSFGEIIAATPVGNDPALRKQYADNLLEDLLLYGLYPEVYTEGNPTFRKEHLTRLMDSYLFKDILAYERIQRSQAIVDLTRALAYQIGGLVSENELASRLKLDRKTVQHYLEILEKAYVIRRLTPFSNNPRQDIGKLSKIYFTDLGIRNALIGDFNPLMVRQDVGALWENFIILERMKLHSNQVQVVQAHFWRTYNGAEVDYLEVAGKSIQGFEIKYTATNLRGRLESFEQTYSTTVKLVNRDTYLEFLGI